MVRIKEWHFLCTFESHMSALWFRHVLSPFLLPSLLTELSTFHIGSSSVIFLRDTFQTKPDYLQQHGGHCLVDQGLKILACYRHFWNLLESCKFCHWKNTYSHKSLPFDTMEQMDLDQGCHLDKAILSEAKPNSLFHHLRVCTDWVWSGWKLRLRLAFFGSSQAVTSESPITNTHPTTGAQRTKSLQEQEVLSVHCSTCRNFSTCSMNEYICSMTLRYLSYKLLPKFCVYVIDCKELCTGLHVKLDRTLTFPLFSRHHCSLLLSFGCISYHISSSFHHAPFCIFDE